VTRTTLEALPVRKLEQRIIASGLKHTVRIEMEAIEAGGKTIIREMMVKRDTMPSKHIAEFGQMTRERHASGFALSTRVSSRRTM
jgi:hypothetical protein